MLELESVSVRYEEKTVLSDFSFSAQERRSTCILGASGCGKTTLWRLAAGLSKPDHGRVSEYEHERASFVFQENRLLPWCSALGNITAVGVEKDCAREYLAKMGLAGEEKSLPEELSGGMKRRLAIARALAYGGDVFFLDEPLQGLDLRTAGEVLTVLREELAGKTALMITHDPEEALALADRIVVAKGPPLTVTLDEPASAFGSEHELEIILKRKPQEAAL